MLIAGAGMAGLLAGHMLRRHSPTIVERQPSLPHNHSALLRFRTNKVAEATGIPFKPVTVRKAIFNARGLNDHASIADNNEYSAKVTGEIHSRSVIDLTVGVRYIAPDDFISQMAKGLDIEYETSFNIFPNKDGPWPQRDGEIIISTIPMPILMDMVGWNKPEFKWLPIWSHTLWLETPVTDVYQTIYYPSQGQPFYRASLTGHRLTIEYIREPGDELIYVNANRVLADFGICTRFSEAKYHCGGLKRQEYGKLLPIDEAERKSFIMAMTDQYSIWSLGRFATWRQLLLDDIVDDVRFIDRVLTTKDQYSRRLHHHNS